MGAVLLLATAVVALWCQRQALRAAWERWHAQHLVSEVGCFARLDDACRVGDTKAAYTALLCWLDSTHHGHDAATIVAFLSRHPDPDLWRQVEALQESFLGQATPWHGAALAAALRQTRRQRLGQRTTAEAAQLPALNPR